MTEERTHPFELIFSEIAPMRFPSITSEMGAARDLAAFLSAESAIELLNEIRPDEGLHGATDEFVAFVHAAWAWWADGSNGIELDRAATAELLAAPDDGGTLPPQVMYIQVEPRRLWARLGEDEAHEPLDGWFALPLGNDRLRVVACLGVHPARPGLSVMVAEGVAPRLPEVRPGGGDRFAPQMDGGAEAGLASVASVEELLFLAWHSPNR